MLLLGVSPIWAQPKATGYKPPEDIAFRKATIVSEGSRLAAECFTLKENTDKALPTVIMSHGWGGVAATLRQTAIDFARAGYFVVVFDYRGWGASEGKIVPTKPLQRLLQHSDVFGDVLAFRAIGLADRFQDMSKPRPAPARLRREVGAAPKRRAAGSQKHG